MQGKSSSNELPQLLFIWKHLNFFLTLTGVWPDIGFLLDSLFLTSNVSDEKSADFLIEDLLYVIIHFSFAAFKILSLSLAFESLIIVCLSVDLFEFILLGVYWASWMFMFMSFIRFEKSSAIISSNIFSTSFSLFSFSGTSTMCMLVCLVVSHWSLGLCSLFFSLFLSVPQYQQFLLSCSQVYWFFLLPIQIWMWIPLVNFSFQLLYFLAPEFFCLFLFLLGFLSLYWYFYFVHI